MNVNEELRVALLNEVSEWECLHQACEVLVDIPATETEIIDTLESVLTEEGHDSYFEESPDCETYFLSHPFDQYDDEEEKGYTCISVCFAEDIDWPMFVFILKEERNE